ncbi:PREDICTED: leucine-rich repeat-containing protein 56 isoform X1 [Ceratotherium simum simum]|uniref:Leucine-rich repeat-containing protein 56 isoform X1 n=1 Tax=Ceratotherium simum simum TaxID=73337 RepID=A0ABM1DHN2_CERSS|nr:PREDICTED: leucine-rich repeat-containing protein 56 isoform X1 [Ceratotherium simum simum]
MCMDPAWDRARGPRPSTASVHVQDLSWQGLHNPCPQSKAPGSHGGGHSEQLVEECLAPARLKALARVDDLRLVSILEMRVDTRENSLGNFGVHLPNLSQLKLNGSHLGSVRDLGTSLGRLQVLWLARCGLTDVDGIGSFPALKELYVSYNDVSDLSPLCLLEQLEVLDLEGNSVEDLGQVRYLQLCPQLATLTLEGNLVCLRPGPGPTNKVPPGYNYRAEVTKLIPQLQILDEVPATHTGLPASWKLDQDWLMVKEAIKEGSVLDGLLPGLGAGRVLCGNPSKGLRERRHQCQAWAPPEQLPPHRPEDLAASASTPGPDPVDDHNLLALARLQAWRELHLRCLESQQEGATAPRCPPRGPEEQKDPAGLKTPPSPPSPAPEPSRPLGWNLIPSPPKFPTPPDSGSTSRGSADLQFRHRRLRALGSVGPGLGQGLAAVTALRALEVASGSSPRAQGCPDPAARPPGLRCMPRLTPITPAQSHP